MKYWSEKHESSVFKIGSRLIATKQGRSWPVTRANDLDSLAFQSIITLPIPEPHKNSLVFLSLQEIDGQFDLSNFKSILERKLSEWLVERQSKSKFRYLLPLDLPVRRLEFECSPIRCLGRHFVFREIYDLRSHLGEALTKADEWTRFAFEKLGHTGTYFVETDVEDYSFDEGYNAQVASQFSSFLGVMEFALNSGTTYHGSNWRQRGSIPHPTFALCLQDGKPMRLFEFDVLKWESGRHLWRDEQSKFCEALKQICACISESSQDGSIERLLARIFLIYSNAMAEKSFHFTMLAFWQLAEALTLRPDEYGKAELVVARLSSFEKRITSKAEGSLRICLDMIKRKRNELVHKAQGDHIYDDEINTLKLACEAAINWLLQHHLQLKTEAHLHDWWTYYTMQAKNLERTKDIIDFVNHMRSSEVTPVREY